MPTSRSEERDGEAWFLGVLERYEGPLLSYAARLCRGDVERARDAVQDVFLRLVRADRSALGERLSVWLFRVCRNRALELRARESRMEALDAEGTAPDDADDGPLERIALADDAARVRRLVAGLPERERELVRLKFEQGLSYQEMGAITGLSATN